jgi:hypothetical protein
MVFIASACLRSHGSARVAAEARWVKVFASFFKKKQKLLGLT